MPVVPARSIVARMRSTAASSTDAPIVSERRSNSAAERVACLLAIALLPVACMGSSGTAMQVRVLPVRQATAGILQRLSQRARGVVSGLRAVSSVIGQGDDVVGRAKNAGD
jgi:hypothetical protein